MHCFGERILSLTTSEIWESKYYAVMFDETDVSCKSQYSVYSWYVNGGNIFEDFVGFTDLR